MLSATLAHQGRLQAGQAQAIRMAVWGEQDEFDAYTARLTGDARQVVADDRERDAALAAFGLRAEQGDEGE